MVASSHISISIMKLYTDCMQAAMVLVSATYNIHGPLYGKRGARGQIRVPGLEPVKLVDHLPIHLICVLPCVSFD